MERPKTRKGSASATRSLHLFDIANVESIVGPIVLCSDGAKPGIVSDGGKAVLAHEGGDTLDPVSVLDAPVIILQRAPIALPAS